MADRAPVDIPSPVLEQIEKIRQTRRCDMEDRRAVLRVADQLGHHAAAWWIGEYPTDYIRGTMHGFKPYLCLRLTYAVSIDYPDDSPRVIDRNLSREEAVQMCRDLALRRKDYPRGCQFRASLEYTRPEPSS